MEWSKYGTVIGYTLLALALSCVTAYVAGYFLFVFLNC